MTPADELRRLDSGPRDREAPGGAVLVEVQATAADPGGVVERSREVLRAVLRTVEKAHGWPEIEVWRERLPGWFVEGCAPEQTPEQTQRWLDWWRGLDDGARAEAAAQRPWTLADWLYWLQPDQRQWYWWDGGVAAAHRARVVVAVPGDPAPLGALAWLLRVAGADSVQTD